MISQISAPRLKGHRFPRSIISYAVWVYYRFSLSLRDVEDLLAELGIVVSYEAIRAWGGKFGPQIAKRVRAERKRNGPPDHRNETRNRNPEPHDPPRSRSVRTCRINASGKGHLQLQPDPCNKVIQHDDNGKWCKIAKGQIIPGSKGAAFCAIHMPEYQPPTSGNQKRGQ